MSVPASGAAIDVWLVTLHVLLLVLLLMINAVSNWPWVFATLMMHCDMVICPETGVSLLAVRPFSSGRHSTMIQLRVALLFSNTAARKRQVTSPTPLVDFSQGSVLAVIEVTQREVSTEASE